MPSYQCTDNLIGHLLNRECGLNKTQGPCQNRKMFTSFPLHRTITLGNPEITPVVQGRPVDIKAVEWFSCGFSPNGNYYTLFNLKTSTLCIYNYRGCMRQDIESFEDVFHQRGKIQLQINQLGVEIMYYCYSDDSKYLILFVNDCRHVSHSKTAQVVDVANCKITSIAFVRCRYPNGIAINYPKFAIVDEMTQEIGIYEIMNKGLIYVLDKSAGMVKGNVINEITFISPYKLLIILKKANLENNVALIMDYRGFQIMKLYETMSQELMKTVLDGIDYILPRSWTNQFSPNTNELFQDMLRKKYSQIVSDTSDFSFLQTLMSFKLLSRNMSSPYLDREIVTSECVDELVLCVFAGNIVHRKDDSILDVDPEVWKFFSKKTKRYLFNIDCQIVTAEFHPTDPMLLFRSSDIDVFRIRVPIIN